MSISFLKSFKNSSVLVARSVNFLLQVFGGSMITMCPDCIGLCCLCGGVGLVGGMLGSGQIVERLTLLVGEVLGISLCLVGLDRKKYSKRRYRYKSHFQQLERSRIFQIVNILCHKHATKGSHG